MPLTFEPDIHFDAMTDAAYLWADDEKGGRFKLMVTHNHLRRYGLRQFDDKRARELIVAHRTDLEAKAATAHAAGKTELILG